MNSQEFHYYPFAVKLDRCVGCCNNLNDLSDKVCIPNKTEDLNLSVFKMITEINESKILTKHISCECKWKLDEIKCNSNQWWNNDKYDVSVKSIMYAKKIILGILLRAVAKMKNIQQVLWMIQCLEFCYVQLPKWKIFSKYSG